MSTVDLVVPGSIDDPNQPSGGNTYDRRVRAGLRAAGWDVREHRAPGSWPCPDAVAQRLLAESIGRVPDGQVVLIDGLIACAVPAVVVSEARRLSFVVLMHLPLGAAENGHDARAGECAVLSAVSAVIATSSWTRNWLVRHYAVNTQRIHVAEPGTAPARAVPGTAAGGELLTVGSVTPQKGYDVLLAALAGVADLSWSWTCVGPLDRAPDFVHRIRRRAIDDGLGDRVYFCGPRTPREVDAAYCAADLLVHASRVETYGMVVTEALARGLPVVATDVGGVPEALGRVAGGGRPGLLVPAGNVQSLAGALRRWLLDAPLRARLRQAALERRTTLSGWKTATDRIVRVLTEATG